MLLDLPLVPTPFDARRKLAEELTKREYGVGNTLLQQWWDAIWADFNLEGVSSTPGSWVGALIGTALVAVVIAMVLRTQRNRISGRGRRSSELVDPTVSPADYRRLAEQALAVGQFDQATVAAFRAIVSDLDRRTVLGDQPGRTAHEAATAMSGSFPQQAEAFRFGADWFDLAAYGIDHGEGQRTTGSQARALLDLGTEIAGTRPTFNTANPPVTTSAREGL